jgi:hypothetical protein
LEIAGHKTDRLLNILKTVGASHYISGPSARDYLDEEKFRAAEISLEYMRYDYPEYPQLHSPFDGQVSILDLLFMTGPQAMRFINNTATRADRDEIPASPAVAPSSQHQFAFNEASRETAVSFSGRYAGGGK